MLTLPRSGAVVSWANAWLLGLATLDDAADACVGGDARHRVVGVPSESEPVSWSVALGRLRAAEVTGFRLVLPVPGDANGLPGPPAFNTAAIAAEEAVIAIGTARCFGVVPTVEDGVVRWDVSDVPALLAAPAAAQVSEAEQALAAVLRDATATLESLDLARGRDDVALDLAALDHTLRRFVPAPGLSGRAARLVVQAGRLRAVAALALSDDGGAITAAESQRRRTALVPVAAACRHALAAAYSFALEDTGSRPPGGG